MTAINQDFKVFSGADRGIVFEVTEVAGDPPVPTGISVDLTGAAITWVVKLRRKRGDPPLITKTLASGSITIDPVDPSVCIVDLMASDTEDLDGRVYYHELEIIDAAGHEEPASVGRMFLTDNLAE